MPRSMRAACATAARSWFKSAAVFILSPSTPGISWRLLHLTRRVTIHFFGQGNMPCLPYHALENHGRVASRKHQSGVHIKHKTKSCILHHIRNIRPFRPKMTKRGSTGLDGSVGSGVDGGTYES